MTLEEYKEMRKREREEKRKNTPRPNVKLYAVIPFKNDEYEGIQLLWSGDVGFGQYDVFREVSDDETPWQADSEFMDEPGERRFLKDLLCQWADGIS